MNHGTIPRSSSTKSSRRTNRKLDAAFEQRILARVRQRYANFGPTLAAEHLAKEGWSVSRESLRKWDRVRGASGVEGGRLDAVEALRTND